MANGLAPVLIARCLECHQTVNASGGLDLSSIDTLRRDHVGLYGGLVSTPRIDALGRGGQVPGAVPGQQPGPGGVGVAAGK